MNRWLLMCWVGCFLGCATTKPHVPPPTPKKDVEPWRQQTVALHVTGFDFAGDNVRPVSWSGTGVFVRPDVLVTNAHVAARALEIQGVDDLGNKHTFDHIIALDLENDLAILRAKNPTTFTSRRLNKAPKALEILAIGNTAGLGLSVYEGSIHKIAEERIIHSARISSGSSGGPLFSRDASVLYGINHACDFQADTSIAIPAWLVDALLQKAATREDTALEDVFILDDTVQLFQDTPRRVCLEAGEATQWVMPLSNGLDLLIDLTPEQETTKWHYHVSYNEERPRNLDLGAFQGALRRAHTTPRADIYTVTLSNKSSQRACLRTRVGQVDWGASMEQEEAP